MTRMLLVWQRCGSVIFDDFGGIILIDVLRIVFFVGHGNGSIQYTLLYELSLEVASRS